MMDSAWQRLDLGARSALPFTTTLLCLFLGVIPWPLPFIGAVTPPLILIALYYWTVHRPDLFRPSMVFALGLLNDIINYMPIGISAILYLCVYQIILTQRRYFTRQSFFTLWMGFVIIVFITQILGWTMTSFYLSHWTPLFPIFMQTLLLCILFPLPCWAFISIQRTMLAQG